MLTLSYKIQDQIIQYLKHRPGWHSSGSIQAMGSHWVNTRMQHPTGSTISRRLRELSRDGRIEEQMVKGNAHYRYKNVG